ncbi:MAG: hypothetical protein JXB23_06975 [Candidatus Aminicenantes bacterium]|nr:hypothetical protein [Candidatus Aminicenantes bacterium]
MSMNVTIPSIGRPETVKDAVILILTNEWPLSIKEIYNRTKDLGINVSYQAAHKTIHNLLESSVIEKMGNKYILSNNWIKDVKKFAEVVERRYENESSTEILKGAKNAKVLNFNSEFEMNTFILKFIEENLSNAKKEDLCCSYWNRSWWTMIYPKEMYSAFKKAKNRDNMYILFSKNTIFDKWAANFCGSFGFNVKCGVKLGYSYDFGVLGDMIIQIYRSERLFDIFDKAVSHMKKNTVGVNNFVKSVFDIKSNVQIVYLRNEKLAENLSKEVLEVFGEKETKNGPRNFYRKID